MLARRFTTIFGARPFRVTDLFAGGAYNGFYFDFTIGPTGAAISSIQSYPPPTTTASQGTAGFRPTWNAGGYANFDGIDDCLTTSFIPSSTITVAACWRSNNTGVQEIVTGGNDGTAAHRAASILITSGGQVGGLFGSDTDTTIKGGSTGRGGGVNNVSLLRAGSNVELWSGENLSAPLYSGNANGTPNTTVAPLIGAFNASSTTFAPLTGRIFRILLINRYIPDNTVAKTLRALSSGIISL